MVWEDNYKHKGLRKRLVDSLKEKGIDNDAILEAMRQLPRHWFLDTAFLEHAYEDKAFAIGEGQTISQPFTVAFQTLLLAPQRHQKVLEIGTGSAYQACVLALMGVKVYSIEYNEVLHKKAKKMVHRLKQERLIKLFCGDGSLGIPAYAPYDAILVTAGAPTVPEALLKQLKIGGAMVIPVGDEKVQEMIRITRKDENIFEQESFGNFKFVTLLGKNGWR